MIVRKEERRNKMEDEDQEISKKNKVKGKKKCWRERRKSER